MQGKPYFSHSYCQDILISAGSFNPVIENLFHNVKKIKHLKKGKRQLKT